MLVNDEFSKWWGIDIKSISNKCVELQMTVRKEMISLIFTFRQKNDLYNELLRCTKKSCKLFNRELSEQEKKLVSEAQNYASTLLFRN